MFMNNDPFHYSRLVIHKAYYSYYSFNKVTSSVHNMLIFKLDLKVILG